MLALLTTFLIVAYVFAPSVFFRIVVGLSVKLRLFQLTKTQEISFGILVAVLPFTLACVSVWHIPPATGYPFHQSIGTLDQYRADRRLVTQFLLSSDAAKLLEPQAGNVNPYWAALGRVTRRQFRFLFWFYSYTVVEGFLFASLVRRYGDWWESHKRYGGFVRKFLMPTISEWHLLLTDFGFPKKPPRRVEADVLCGDQLYRGGVADYFLDVNGKLSGIYMKDVSRFRRKEYEDAVANAADADVDRDRFWRAIPGSNFYLPADKISNLNVRFPFANKEDDENLVFEELVSWFEAEPLTDGFSVAIDEPEQLEGEDEDNLEPPAARSSG